MPREGYGDRRRSAPGGWGGGGQGEGEKRAAVQIQDSSVFVGAKSVAFLFLLLLFLPKQLQLLMESRRADVTGNSYRAARRRRHTDGGSEKNV